MGLVAATPPPDKNVESGRSLRIVGPVAVLGTALLVAVVIQSGGYEIGGRNQWPTHTPPDVPAPADFSDFDAHIVGTWEWLRSEPIVVLELRINRTFELIVEREGLDTCAGSWRTENGEALLLVDCAGAQIATLSWSELSSERGHGRLLRALGRER